MPYINMMFWNTGMFEATLEGTANGRWQNAPQVR